LREARNCSQGEIEKRTGLLGCYLSRVENGHIVPSVESLEKLTRALEIPMYQLFDDGDKPPKAAILPRRVSGGAAEWGSSDKEAQMLRQFRRPLSKVKEEDRRTLLSMAQKMAESGR